MYCCRGDIFYADLSPVIGSEQGGVRPVLILQNNIGNRFSPTVIVAAITGQSKTSLPTHVQIDGKCGLSSNSTVLLEQIRTIDKKRLKERIGNIRWSKTIMHDVDEALVASFALSPSSNAKVQS